MKIATLPGQVKRINIHMSFAAMVVELADDHDDAETVLDAVFLQAERIDPQAAGGPLQKFVALDQLEIYGADIWTLYSEVCQKNLISFCAVLRAIQFGFIKQDALRAMIADPQIGAIPVPELVRQVKSVLSEFDKK